MVAISAPWMPGVGRKSPAMAAACHDFRIATFDESFKPKYF